MIAYAGVSLAHPTADALARWDRWRDRHAEEPVAPAGFAAPGLDHLPVPAYSRHVYSRARLNTLVWPTGASRWATFHALATGAQLAAITTAVGDANTAQTLEIGTTNNGGRRVSTLMYLLAPRVVFDGYSLAHPLYLLTLVDERWYWWQETSGTAPDTTSWTTLITGLLTAVGVTPTVGTIPSGYGTPDPDRWADLTHRPLPVLIDAAAESVGCRVVRQTGGGVLVVTAATCLTREETNWTAYRDRLETGGRATPAQIGRTLPATATTVFPGTTPATADRTLTASGVFTGETVTGVAGRVAVLHADLAATAGAGARTSYAEAAGDDWYRLALARVDAVFGGVCLWESTGLEDRAEYEWLPPCGDHPDARVLTRVVPWPAWDRNRYGGRAGGAASAEGNPSGCTPPGIDTSECLQFAVSAGAGRCADIAAATVLASLSGGWWVASDPITTAAGNGTISYRINTTGYPEMKITVGATDYYGTPAGCDASDRPRFAFGGSALCDGTVSTETCSNGFTVAVGCVPCGYDECTGWYCDNATGVVYYAANCAAYDLLEDLLDGSAPTPTHPPCSAAPESIRVDMVSTTACLGSRAATIPRTGVGPYVYTGVDSDLGQLDCGLDNGFVLTCTGDAWVCAFDNQSFTLVAASTTPFALVFRHTGTFSGSAGVGTVTLTITAAP